MATDPAPRPPDAPRDFIRAMVAANQAAGRWGGRVVTRFPPEPNGYPHIGHAKSIHLNFGIAREFGGVCHLRFDDTNPETEDLEYVEAILRDLKWLGFDPGDKVYYASDYFERLYQWAEELIRRGAAYVCPLSEEQISEWRGTISEPGRPSPGRDRSVEENLDLFRRMRAGEFPDGAYTLRAKIDMAAANMKLRDPLLYRIRHTPHYRQGDRWCIYPMYDYAHPLSDAIEGITSSICTLEFENNRDIYDWLLRTLEIPDPPQQTEFARLNLSYTVMSKRKLLVLVQQGRVNGWDDPRMPTLSGLRRRGVTPEAIADFCERVGVARANSLVDMALLESCIRDALNPVAPRVMAVSRPLKLTVTTWPEGHVEVFDAPLHPDAGHLGTRPLAFGRELWIERDDFAEVPPPGWHRLAPGAEVRLRHAYVVRCDEVVKDAAGEVVELRCSHDPTSKSGKGARRVKGTLHWVAAATAVPVELRLYDRLFAVERPGEERDVLEDLNPRSLTVLQGWIEPSVDRDPPDTRYQFERLGYFWRDPVDGLGERRVFNRIVGLKDGWAKQTEAPAPRPAAPVVPAPTPPAAERPLEGAAAERYLRYVSAGAGAQEARRIAQNPALAALFEAGLSAGAAATLAPLVALDLPRAAGDRDLATLPVNGEALGRLARRVEDGTLSTALARQVLAELVERGGDPDAIVAARGLTPLDDAALDAAVDAALAESPEQVAAYRGGRVGLLGYFVGRVMKSTGGRADAARVRDRLKAKLG